MVLAMNMGGIDVPHFQARTRLCGPPNSKGGLVLKRKGDSNW